MNILLIQQPGEAPPSIARLLSRSGNCSFAANLGEAIEKIQETAPDLIFYIHSSSREDNQSFTVELQKSSSSSRFLVLLPASRMELEEGYRDAGLDGYFLDDANDVLPFLSLIQKELRHSRETETVRMDSGKHMSSPKQSNHEKEDFSILQPGEKILHYQIQKRIGYGAMGEVYKASDLKLGRTVAVKVLHPRIMKEESAKIRLVREARTASALNHPNIVTIHSIEDYLGQSFIVMEYVEGKSLRDLLEDGPLEFPRLLELGSQIADALDAAHAVGLIHRDIKPANIMITRRGQVKLLDFGLAKKMASPIQFQGEDPVNDKRLTEMGMAVGTVVYMSPEQTRGDELSERSDIFSLGTVLYEAATGALPFDGPSTLSIFHEIATSDPIPPTSIRPDLPAEFDLVISYALAKDEQDRFQRASDLANSLRALQTNTVSSSGERPKLFRSSGASTQTSRKQIAVLYFENLTGMKEEEYLRDGLTEDVITELSKIKTLRIFPRSSVVGFRDKVVTVQQVARQLNAGFVLTGTMRRAADRVRITAQLAESSTGHACWAERYDRKLMDVLDLQEEIARSIAQALEITLSPQEEAAIASKPTGNSQVYDYYLRGRNYTRRATRPDLDFAMMMFQRALDLEPGFALAHAGLANVCGLYYDWYEQNQSWILKGLESSERALALNPELAEGLAARARIFWGERKYQQAIDYSQRALERKPDCEGAYWIMGLAYFALERSSEGVEFIDRMIQFSGDDYNSYVPYINMLGILGREEDTKNLRLKQTQVLKQQLEWVPEDVRARMLLSTHYASFGNQTDAVQELQRALALRPEDANVLYNAACTYAVLGMKQEAIQHVKLALKVGYHNRDWVGKDPDLLCLHDEPEFQEIISKH